jgi:hypothetical protein
MEREGQERVGHESPRGHRIGDGEQETPERPAAERDAGRCHLRRRCAGIGRVAEPGDHPGLGQLFLVSGATACCQAETAGQWIGEPLPVD